MNKERVKRSLVSSTRPLLKSIPIIIGVVLLISLISTAIPQQMIKTIFSSNAILDSVVGAAAGSIMAGNAITSYILGGELLAQGVGLAGVSAFLLAWVTVGIVQLPAESMILSKKFAIIRNSISFIFSIIGGLLLYIAL